MELFHGSEIISEKPLFGSGNPFNDYGLGFYCTREINLAREWACTEGKDGFVNKYDFNLDGLRVLYLNSGKYNILHWLSILLQNRRFDLSTPVSVQARQYLLDHFLPDYRRYDVIIGYRADDSYFSFARAFLANGITLEQLSRAMTLGKLGEQIVIVSEAAFSRLHFIASEPVDANVFFPRRMFRDRQARNDYLSILAEAPEENPIYVTDIIHGKSI